MEYQDQIGKPQFPNWNQSPHFHEVGTCIQVYAAELPKK